MKKQLKNWQKDFEKYWDKTSLMGRVIIGAFISFIIALIFLAYIIKPVRKELKKLKAKAREIGTIPGTQDIKDYDEQIEIKKRSLHSWNEKLERKKKAGIPLDEGAYSTVISAVDNLLGECRILLKERSDIEEKKSDKRKKGGTAVNPAAKTAKHSSFTGVYRHKYVTNSRFINIIKFFKELRDLPHLFKIDNISVEESESESLKGSGILRFEFEITVMYLIGKRNQE